MNAAFHYIVKGKLIRFRESNIDFLEFEEKFENENPIVARKEAFRYYQNYIDVFLQSKGREYVSHTQTKKDLNSFVDPGKKKAILMGDREIEYSDAYGNGIGIFLVIDKPKLDDSDEDKTGDELFIHGIGNIGCFSDDPDRIIFELSKELEYFKHYNYDTLDEERQVDYCSRDEWEEGFRENEPGTYVVLETPFDWMGFDKPYWWGEPSDENTPVPPSLEELIAQGENNQVEFKPTLVYNFKTSKPGIGIKAIIAKAICAFLNSNGGYLFIGIDDNGKVLGLNNDFGLAEEKKPKDYFRLEFDQMLEHFLSISVIDSVIGKFYEIDGKDVFVVSVYPNKRRPIFFKGQNAKEFYVRAHASSRHITDIEELANYCIEKWGK